MSQQQLKLQKTSHSAAVPTSGQVAESRKDQHQYQDQQHGKQTTSQHLSKGKSELQTFGKKLQRRDLNLIPPSAAIVQSDPYATNANDNRFGYQLTLNSTQNRNYASGWDQIDPQQSRVTTVKHEKGLPNGTIMQCLKQFQRTKQQRQANHQPQNDEQLASATLSDKSHGKPKFNLQQVTPVASQNVANMPISTKSNKSQKQTKTRTQGANNAVMAAEAQVQRRQNFTCTTTTKGSLRLSKKSPSNGRDPANNMVNQGGRIPQQRDRSQNTKQASQVASHHQQTYATHKGMTRGSTSQQHNSANDKLSRQVPKTTTKKLGATGANKAEKILTDMDFESNFAMLMRIQEERSNESRPALLVDSQKMMLLPQGNNPYEPVKLISPNTTTNRQSSHDAKLLTLKNFQPAKQINSNIGTPKYLKFKLGGEKKGEESSNDNARPTKTQSKSQISTHKPSKTREHKMYGTQGTSPENRAQQTKSLSNNSRQKFASQNTGNQPQQQQYPHSTCLNSNQSKSVKPSTSKASYNLNVKLKSGGAPAQQPTAPQMRYSVPPESKKRLPIDSSQDVSNSQAQAQQQIQNSSSALNGSSELQKRFTRGEIGSQNEASVSSGKANKSFQFGHNTALMSCSSGGDSSNPPQTGVRRRSSSGKNGKQQIKIDQIRNVHPVNIQPATSTSASVSNNDNSYLNLRKQVPQSTQNQNQAKRFTFTLNPRDQQKASRPNKHDVPAGTNPSTTKAATLKTFMSNVTTSGHVLVQPQRDPSANKSATKGKSVSAKKGKITGKESANAATTASKNLTFDKLGRIEERKAQSREHKKHLKDKTPDEIMYESVQHQKQQQVIQTRQKTGKMVHSIPTHPKVITESQGGSQHRNVRISEQVGKHSQDSTFNSSFVQASKPSKDGQARKQKKGHSKKISGDFSLSNEQQRPDSIGDDSSQLLSQQTHHFGQSLEKSQDGIVNSGYTGNHSQEPLPEGTYFNHMSEELKMKDNLIQQLQLALGRKDEQLNALTKNCEVLSTSLKARDEKRDQSQQAIKDTLKNLEQKLQMFTEQSQHNQGGLRQITQSPFEAKRISQNINRNQLGRNQVGFSEVLSNSGNHASATPNLSKQAMEPYRLNFQNTQHQQPRPTSSTLLQVPHLMGSGNRRPSQVSEIDSLVTVAEYNGTQCDGYSQYENSAKRNNQPNVHCMSKDTPFAGEGTIGSLASEIQLISAKRQAEHQGINLFKKGEIGDAEELGEMTSLSEMEMSNVHDASLDQLERDLMDTQQKLQEQSHKAADFVKTQQNNFMDLKANLKASNDKHVIFEDSEEAEEDMAQIIPKRKADVAAQLSMTQKIGAQNLKQGMKLYTQGDGERPELGGKRTNHTRSDEQGYMPNFKSQSQVSDPSSHLSYQTKLSKTLSKNKMKLKLAGEILNIKRDQQLVQQDNSVGPAEESEDVAHRSNSGLQMAENSYRYGEQRDMTKKVAKKKIQLPMKIPKGPDSSRLVRQNKSQERGTLSNHSTSGQQTQVFNSVAIRGLKNTPVLSVSDEPLMTHLAAKSPQNRQSHQVQGQGNMLSNRLSTKQSSHQTTSDAQKIEKLTEKQLLLVQKLQGQKIASSEQQQQYSQIGNEQTTKGTLRKERRQH